MPKINRSSTSYIIRTLSPMHVGAGDASYGVIDKLVQRDSLTNHPVIHSSSMKGALREYFEYWFRTRYEAEETEEKINLIFGRGTQTNGEEGSNGYAAGLYDFDLGFLLSLPVRTDKAAYVSATTPEILIRFLERLELFGLEEAHASAQAALLPLLQASAELDDRPMVFNDALNGAILEDEAFKATHVDLNNLAEIENILGKNPALVPKDQFADLVESLPVIARNKLDNGQSKNLWYEETVPRESRFFTIISKAEWESSDTSMASVNDLFDQVLRDKRIQLGGNATVGYGKTVFTPIS